MLTVNVTAGLAFLAGLASFLSPCVFALIPAYIGYLSGRSVAAAQTDVNRVNTLNTLLHGIAFILGFSAVFLTLGLTMSAIGSLLYDFRAVLAKLGGVIVVVFWASYDRIAAFEFP